MWKVLPVVNLVLAVKSEGPRHSLMYASRVCKPYLRKGEGRETMENS